MYVKIFQVHLPFSQSTSDLLERILVSPPPYHPVLNILKRCGFHRLAELMPRKKKLWKEAQLTILGEQRSAGEFWDAGRNPGVDSESAGVQDETQVYLWRMCKRHHMFQSFKSVIDNFKKGHGTSMNCKVCWMFNDLIDAFEAQEPSEYEETAHLFMSLAYGFDWIVDARVLKSGFGSVDIWVPALKLFFMIDGEGHFNVHHDRSVQVQEERDDAFNYEAIGKGFTVLRLHFKDHNLFQKKMKDMIAECERHPQRKPSLNWSPSFCRAKESL